MANNSMMNNESNNKKPIKYTRQLSYFDLVFAGYGFIIGAGIFTLMPYIIGYSQGYSWGAFVLGFIVSILTGLSFARLNFEYPDNEAEYSWIINILSDFDSGSKVPKKSPKNTFVRYFANIVIYAVAILCILGCGALVAGIKDIISTYNFGLSNFVIMLLLLGFPTIVNIFGVKYTKTLNKITMTIVTLAFLCVAGIALKHHDHFKDNKFATVKTKATLPGMVRGAFISILAYNGFQSVVQLSEETKHIEDIPKGIVTSVSISTVLYLIVTISIISIIGLKKASNSVYPFAEAFSTVAGGRGRDIVNILAVVAGTNTLLLQVFSSSRLLQKLSVLGLLPRYLQKLMPATKLLGPLQFEKVDMEEFSSDNNKDVFSKYFENMPIYAIITFFVVVMIVVVAGKGILELLTSASNMIAFFIFTSVNILCVVNHYKSKEKVTYNKIENKTLKGFVNMYPWYSILGALISFIFLMLAPGYMKDIKPRTPP
jgi:basic amino acid/polyamine antiporter, APA family